MERTKFFIPIMLTIFLLLPVYAFTEEDAISGKASVTIRTVQGERESAKFEEYRDVPDGLSGEIELRYKKDSYFLELKAKDIAEDDQNLTFRAGNYGKYRIEIIYDKIPHRFAYDAKTLYSGTGSGNLSIADAIQANLQGSTSATDVANRLRGYLNDASTVDLQLFRKTGKVNVDIMALDPFNLRAEFSREKREGTRPFGGSFGFGNPIEIPEPIDYDTTQARLIAEYTKKPLYLSASYYISVFDNNIDTLTWDNPFRITDSTAANAYTLNYAGGPSKGLIDLYPNNKYSNLTLTGSLMDLPLKTRLTATASLGWMRQDDDLVSYTTNTAISTGAVSGVTGVTVPFNAWDRANLPTNSVDAKVDTSLYNVQLTSRPADFVHLKARYRYYEYDNKTGIIEFPGYVRFDAVWEPGTVENEPTSYKKKTAGLDLGFNIFKATTLTLGYTYENMKRSSNREVTDQDDNIYKVSLDTKPLSWLDLRTSYERSQRRGDYDFTAPLEIVYVTPPATGPEYSQLPWLRKYDEANRDRDRVQFLVTIYPVDPLTLTGSVIFGKDNYKDSPFGLLDNKHQIYSIDADYAVSERLNLFAFYSFEKYKNNQKARQWNPSTAVGSSDPYYGTTTYDSPSNWDAEGEDKIDTIGGGVNLTILPKKLDFRVSYSYSKTDGKVKLSSPLGTSTNDTNLFTPVDFTEVDDIKLQTLHAKVRYQIRKGLSASVGYMWEKFDVKDFNNNGFDYVPTTTTGAYNALVPMGTLLKNYNVNIVYTKLTYSF